MWGTSTRRHIQIETPWHTRAFITTPALITTPAQSLGFALTLRNFCKRRLWPARPCAGAMSFLDAQTSALLAGLQTKTPSGSFWNSCAASLYTSAQCSPGLPAHASQSPPFRSVTANSSVHGLADSMRTRPLTQASRTSQLKTLPCPVLYQAKEPEAIADVLRRAGKKALGGGIPGRVRSDLASPTPYRSSCLSACLFNPRHVCF